MARKIINLSLLVFICLNFTFCSDDKVEPIFLNVQTSVVFASVEGSKVISVSTNAVNWSFNVDQVDWINVSKNSGLDGLSISVTKNNNQDSRSTTIHVTTGEIKKDIKIEQLGNDGKIIVSTPIITVPAIGGKIVFSVNSNVDFDILIPDSINWIVEKSTKASARSALVSKDFELFVDWSKEFNDRSTELTVKEKDGGLSEKILIIQKGQKNYTPGEFPDISDISDIKIKVISATASSFQQGGEIAKSYDDNMGTLYHSNLDNSSSDYFPITLEYNLEKVEQLDYIIYHPREDNKNIGNFKVVDVLVSTESRPGFTLVKTVDLEGSNTPSKIAFDEPIIEPTTVRFVVKSGVGAGQGFASCAEMEFYTIDPDGFDPLTIFTDESYSELKEGVTEDDILSIKATFFKNMAYYIYLGVYPSEFRIQEYKAWPSPDKFANENKISAYSLLDNPTGIQVKSGEELLVFVGPTHGFNNLRIKVQNLDYPNGDGYSLNSSFYSLKEGVNKIVMDRDGLLYVFYHTENYKNASPIKIHFATGQVNGYFDSQKHDKSDWKRLLNAATDKHFDVVGKYAHMTFPTASFKQHTKDGLALVQAYDSLVFWEQDFMGFHKYGRYPVNRMYFNVMYGSSYMYATANRTSYSEGTMADVMCDINRFKEKCWGPAHEVGHVHQTRPGLKWHGTTEVTNNIHSMYVQHMFGKPPYLMETVAGGYSNYYEKAYRFAFVNRIAHPVEKDYFCKLVPFWQLQVYFASAIGMPDFYKDLYEQIRIRPDKSTPGEQQLEFVKIASEIANMNLTEFFEYWGFLSPVDAVINDYGEQRFVVTQSQIEKIKSEVDALNLPDPEFPIHYVCDDNWRNIKNRSEIKEGSATRTGNTFKMNGWDNVMAYEVWNNDKLVFIGNSSSFTVTTSVSDNTKLYAVDYKGNKTSISFN